LFNLPDTFNLYTYNLAFLGKYIRKLNIGDNVNRNFSGGKYPLNNKICND